MESFVLLLLMIDPKEILKFLSEIAYLLSLNLSIIYGIEIDRLPWAYKLLLDPTVVLILCKFMPNLYGIKPYKNDIYVL